MQVIDLKTTIPESLAGKRLDQALAALFPAHSRSRHQQWVLNGAVQLEGHTVLVPKTKVAAGQRVIIQAQLESETAWTAEAMALTVVYHDDDLIVINKPAGLVVHPAPGHRQGTLVNALLHQFPELAVLPRAGIIHRLDKDTSGLLVVARSLAAHTKLVADLQARLFHRHYIALVEGQLIAGGTVDAPIGRHPHLRTKMAVSATGKPAITHYRIRERFKAHTLLDITLETGRTHQIRVHMAHIKHPIVGDSTYGGRLKIAKVDNEALKTALRTFPRQALHATSLKLAHPLTQKPLDFNAPIPEDMLKLIMLLRSEQS